MRVMQNKMPCVIWLGVIVLAISMIPFLRSIGYGLIDLDDYCYLTNHPLVRHWQGLESFRHVFNDMSECIWMPLTWMSYAMDFALWGEWWGGFHLHAVALHFTNACLLWLLLCLLFRGRPALCLLAALVWAVHPLRCESVVFLASRKDVLSFFWELLALVFWVKGSAIEPTSDRQSPSSNQRVLCTAASFLFFILGSFCKPSVMTFPLLCLIIDLFFFRRVYVMRYAAPMVYMLFLGVFAGMQQAAGGATTDIFGQPLWARFVGACAAYGIYLRNFICPHWLALQCVKTWPALPRFWLPGLVISGLVAFWILRRFWGSWDNRRALFSVSFYEERPDVLVYKGETDSLFAGLLWFSLAVAPMLGIASFGFHSFADRFTYIPAVGLSIALIALTERVATRFGRRGSRLMAAALTIPVLAFGAYTWRQTGFWQDDVKLFSHTLEVDGEHNAYARSVLARWQFEFPHDLTACVAEYEKLLKVNPSFSLSSYHVYIMALMELDRGEEANDRLRFFCKYLEERQGKDFVFNMQSDDLNVSKEENAARTTWRCCALAVALCDKIDLRRAEDLLQRFQSDRSFEKDLSMVYLRSRYARLMGDDAKADDLLNRIRRTQDKVGFLRFRFLGEKVKSPIDSQCEK